MRKEVIAMTKYDRARIMGARALQIAMGAPVLVKVPKGVYKPMDVAKLEWEKDAIPITTR